LFIVLILNYKTYILWRTACSVINICGGNISENSEINKDVMKNK